MALMTKIEDWYMAEDVEILGLLEGRFKAPAVYFESINRHEGNVDYGDSVYWYVRMRDVEGVIIVRKSPIGDVYMYGPMKAEALLSVL